MINQRSSSGGYVEVPSSAEFPNKCTASRVRFAWTSYALAVSAMLVIGTCGVFAYQRSSFGNERNTRADQLIDQLCAERPHKAIRDKVIPSAPYGFHPSVGTSRVRFDGQELFFFAMLNDEFVGAQVLEGKVFDPPVLQSMLKHIQPGTTVIDAGANFGSYSMFFAAKTGAGGRVISFEPQRLMYNLICANAIANQLLNVHPIKAALSFKSGTTHMSAQVADGMSQGVAVEVATDSQRAKVNFGGMNLGKGGETVDMFTLDHFNITNVSVLKVDVQGSERLLFYGARQTIRRNMPVIFYEDTDNEFSITQDMIEEMAIPEEVRNFDVKAFLTSLGYVKSTEVKRGTREPPLTDVVFLPPALKGAAQKGAAANAASTRGRSLRA